MAQVKRFKGIMGVIAVAVALGSPSTFAEPSPQSWTDLWRTEGEGRTETINGRITHVETSGNRVVLELDNGIDVRTARDIRVAAGSSTGLRVNELREGDEIRVWGSILNNRVVEARSVELLNGYDYDDERFHRVAVAYLTGTVSDIDRGRELVTLRRPNGELIRVNAAGARGVNVGDLREGERVTFAGRMSGGSFVAIRTDRGSRASGVQRTSTSAWQDADGTRTKPAKQKKAKKQKRNR
jgi:hypothetical protein